MVTKSDQAACDLYVSVMEEVKGRTQTINSLTQGQIGLGPPVIREYCFLQLRMLCELIALGCLIAHGDITKTKYFQREAYKADDIMRRLEKLHPEFYPFPVKPIFNPGSIHLEPITSCFLTKPELIELYGKCGDVLHKGTLDRLINRKPPRMDYGDIQMWGQKLLNLMSAHRITRIGGRFHLIAFLENKSYGGNVQVIVGEQPKSVS